MTFEILEDQSQWDEFVQSIPQASFLQSWAWGKFESSLGHSVYPIGIFEDDRIIGASMLICVHAKRGRYIECIGGPLFSTNSQSYLSDESNKFFKEWMKYVHSIAQKEKVSFLRLRLPVHDSSQVRQWLGQKGFRETYLYYQAETTRIIELSPTSEELFSNMDKQTRYDIRRAERDGVVVTMYEGNDLTEQFEIFFSLYENMVQRQAFVGYSKTYLQNQIQAFLSNQQVRIFIAKLDNEPIAGAVCMYYGDTVTYHHAASVPIAKLSPASLVLWEIMQNAQQAGYIYLDLFGTAPPGKRYESRKGLTEFKSGFGGNEVQWARTHDLVYDPKVYMVNRLIESLPSSIRSIGTRLTKLF